MIIIIAAKAGNVIGSNNELPWYIPEDLNRFKELTTGHPVIMGWNTFVSILSRFRDRTGQAKPLPNRQNYVLTSKKMTEVHEELSSLFPDFNLQDFQTQVFFSRTFAQAVKRAEGMDKEIFIIGGEKVFETALHDADKMELTEIHETYEGDAFFPNYDSKDWQKIKEEDYGKYSFVTYVKRIAHSNGHVH